MCNRNDNDDDDNAALLDRYFEGIEFQSRIEGF